MKTLVTGSHGVGKTHFAKQLQQKRQCALLHLDFLWHSGDYSAQARESYLNDLMTFMTKESKWIIDGNYSSSLPLRLKYADQVIWLRKGRLSCIKNVLKRTLAFYRDRSTRSEMPTTFKEKFDKEYWTFLRFVWDFPVKTEPQLSEYMKAFEGDVIILSTPNAIATFLDKEGLS